MAFDAGVIFADMFIAANIFLAFKLISALCLIPEQRCSGGKVVNVLEPHGISYFIMQAVLQPSALTEVVEERPW